MHDLNGSHEMLLRQQAKMESDYIRRETFEREREAADARFFENKEKMNADLVALQTAFSNLQGKLWLPMIAAAAIAAGLAAAAVALFVK